MYDLKSLLVVILAICSSINADEDPVVQLPEGKIKGHILKSELGKSYYAFQEIPYAAPPTGSNRFQLPKKPQPWTGVLETTKNTKACYQESILYNLTMSEDCLYINVYTPVVPGTTQALPVMVWIHGGRFSRHAGTFQYVGPKFAIDHDVVVVSFNYRMGPFGFLTADDENMPGNIGLKDQLFALEWVQENIGLFGGNKSHVTIAGESAGAMAISLHLLGPWKDNKVLYQAAILQSGSSMFFTRGRNERETAFKIGKIVDSSFSSQDSKDLVEVLQKPTAAELWAATSTSGIMWMPIVEKEGPFSYQMLDSIEKENFKKIPVLLGFNSEEWISEGLKTNLKELAAAYDVDSSKLVPSNFNISAVNRTVAGKLLYKVYTNTTFQDNVGAYIRYSTDNQMTTGITKQAFVQSKHVDVYLYQFAYKGELGGMMNMPFVPGCERVAHAEDLKYIWADDTNSDLTKFAAKDSTMLHRFVLMWTNFVKYHNPTPAADPFLQNVTWPKVDYSQPKNIQYLNMNETLEVRTNPRYYQKVIRVFDEYVTSKDII